MTTKAIMIAAQTLGLPIPAFNVPYLPMIGPVCQALIDTETFGLIAVARLEWIKFESRSQAAVADEYARFKSERHTRLHQDHVPVVDEDGKRVDYIADLERALDLGFDSVMIDASRLGLQENIDATRAVCSLAHERGIPVEGELGAVMGHESGPDLDYEAIFESGRGFTDPAEAAQFVRETDVDWLSVAVGSVHGAISAATKDRAKIQARLNIAHLARIRDAVRIPLVLHGGSGIGLDDLRAAFSNGIAKINIATDIRQPYERSLTDSKEKAQERVYEMVREIVSRLGISGSAKRLGT